MEDKYFDKAMKMVDTLMKRVHISSISNPNHSDKTVIEMTAKAMIDFKNENPSWINVNDRMPEKEQGVLVFITTGFITVAYLKKDEFEGTKIIKSWQLFGDTKTLFVKDFDEITHWMPLPNEPIIN